MEVDLWFFPNCANPNLTKRSITYLGPYLPKNVSPGTHLLAARFDPAPPPAIVETRGPVPVIQRFTYSICRKAAILPCFSFSAYFTLPRRYSNITREIKYILYSAWPNASSTVAHCIARLPNRNRYSGNAKMATTSVRTQMDEVTETLRSEYACGFCKRCVS